MARTIDGLLRLSRLENQTVQTVKSAETETGLVLATTLKSIVAEHGPRIVLSLAADLREHLAIDREHLEAVLNNLLENALRHGAPHEVRVRIRMRSPCFTVCLPAGHTVTVRAVNVRHQLLMLLITQRRPASYVASKFARRTKQIEPSHASHIPDFHQNGSSKL